MPERQRTGQRPLVLRSPIIREHGKSGGPFEAVACAETEALELCQASAFNIAASSYNEARGEKRVGLLVLGLVGATGSGKTTIADVLASDHGFEKLHMGRPLKDMLRALGLSEAAVAGPPEERAAPQPILDGKSARYALSTLGTDWGRNMISPRIWANAVKDRIRNRLSEPHPRLIVIDDLRFPTDWEVVSAFGGAIVRIRRPAVEPTRTPLDVIYHRFGAGHLLRGRGLLGWKPLHETEFHWRDAPCCGEVDNSSSPKAAAAAVLAALASQGRWPPDTVMTF